MSSCVQFEYLLSCDVNEKFFVGKKKNEYMTKLLSLSLSLLQVHTYIDINTHIPNMLS